jgi:hypothetical protein
VIVFVSVVVIAFKSAFRAEMHQNDTFLFIKNYFLNHRIKTIQNTQKINFKKNNFLKNTFAPHSQTVSALMTSSLCRFTFFN